MFNNPGGAGPTTGPAPAPKLQLTPEETKAVLARAAAENTINFKTDKIAETAAKADAVRKEALAYYDSAVKHVDEAEQAAKTVVTDVSNRLSKLTDKRAAEVEALQGMRDLMNQPAAYTLQRASIADKCAAVHANAAGAMALRDQLRAALTPVLADGGLAMPAPVTTFASAADQKKEQDEAVKAYAEAEKLLDDTSKTPTSADQPSVAATVKLANAAMVTTVYAHGEFLAQMGDEKTATELKTQAVTALKAVQGTSVALMPAAMAPELAAAVGIAPIHPTPTTQQSVAGGRGAPRRRTRPRRPRSARSSSSSWTR